MNKGKRLNLFRNQDKNGKVTFRRFSIIRPIFRELEFLPSGDLLTQSEV